MLRRIPLTGTEALLDGRGVVGVGCVTLLDTARGLAGVVVAFLVGGLATSAVLCLRTVLVLADATKEVEEILEVGIGLLPGRRAGVLSDGLASDGRGEADGETIADELEEAIRDPGRTRLAEGVLSAGEMRFERAEDATEEGREVVLG
jgi:hypothetical protein